MLFLEDHARWLLVVHGIAAATLVAASTHHLLWCRHYLHGRFGRARAEQRFALIATGAFVGTFFLGNLLYPTYKVRVRAEYFDSPEAVAAEVQQRREAAARVDDPAPRGGGHGRIGLAWVARLFDIKEHWVALGCASSLLLLLLSRRAHPKDDLRVLPLYLGLSVVVCGTAWAGAVIGLLTVSFRAVGGAT
ncbi:MAG: hypothetical protein EXR72_01245 [Myxococcales bacterium]|nr:hypothetical protein [Myxococcales bacterium]